MKKNLFVLALLLTATITLFTGCDETTTDPVTPPAAKIGFYLTSTPTGAKVIINGKALLIPTPVLVDTLKATTAYNITMVLSNYDTLNFAQSTTSTIDTIKKTLWPSWLNSFGPVRIYETIGTTSSQPSGLSLKYAKALSVAAANKDSVDLYYSSTGFLITSANVYSGLTRKSSFLTGSATNLFDNIASPTFGTGWFNNFKDDETKYVFVFDQDNHYSKLKITTRGGGNPGNPSYVEIQWLYNKIANNTQF